MQRVLALVGNETDRNWLAEEFGDEFDLVHDPTAIEPGSPPDYLVLDLTPQVVDEIDSETGPVCGLLVLRPDEFDDFADALARPDWHERVTNRFKLDLRKRMLVRSVQASRAREQEFTDRIEEAIRRGDDCLTRVNDLEVLEFLVAGTAHDLNNLLTVIVGSLGLARLKRHLPDVVLRRVNEAEKACGTAKSLVRALMDYSRNGSNDEPVALDLRSLVVETVRLVAGTREIQADFLFPDDLSTVAGNEREVRRIFQNLALNACDAMRDGGQILVTAENLVLHGQSGGLSGNCVRIAFRDTGKGIPFERIGRIFEMRFTDKPGGSGIGLAVVQSIVSKMGGQISVSSEVGVGTTFELLFPTVTPKAKSFAGDAPKTGRILVVEDEPTIRLLVARYLEENGYSVTAVGDGERAIQSFQAARAIGIPYDVVLIDIRLPGINGAEVALEMRRVSDVRVIGCSSFTTDPAMAAPDRFGFFRMLPKPFDLDQLRTAIAEALA